MKTRSLIILILLALVWVCAYFFPVSLIQCNSIDSVAWFLKHSADSSYTASVITTTLYNGKAVKAYANVIRQGSMEKIEYKCSGEQATWAITKNNKSYTFIPRSCKLLISEDSHLLSRNTRTDLIKANYRARKIDTQTIAGVNVWVFSVTPKNGSGPFKKLWIDRERCTVLKSVDYSSTGEERGNMEVKKIEYGVKVAPETFDIPADKSIVPIKLCESANSPAIFDKLDFKVKTPKYIPAGYKLEGYHIFHCQCNCNHRAAQITYTDGLNIFSVFETSKNTNCCADACNMKTRGSGCSVETCGVAQLGQKSCQGKTVVIVGDLPAKEIRKIAESVE